MCLGYLTVFHCAARREFGVGCRMKYFGYCTWCDSIIFDSHQCVATLSGWYLFSQFASQVLRAKCAKQKLSDVGNEYI